MAASNSTATAERTVELPPGVQHYNTQCFALAWADYEALTEADGWREESWWVDADGNRCEPDAREVDHLHRSKKATIRGHLLIVYPPAGPRLSAGLIDGALDLTGRDTEAGES